LLRDLIVKVTLSVHEGLLQVLHVSKHIRILNLIINFDLIQATVSISKKSSQSQLKVV
jgi:hypothetical protein